MTDVQDMAKAIMVGHTDTDVDHTRGLYSAMNRAAKAAGITPVVSGGTLAGPFNAPSDDLGILVEQYSSRWPTSDGRACSMTEMIDHIARTAAILPRVIIAPPSVPGTTPSTGWAALPVFTQSQITDETSSYQSGTPKFLADGMHVSLPARGGSPGGSASRPSGDYQRCEVWLNGQTGIGSNTHRFFRYDFTLANGFPTGTTDWQTIAQLKNDDTGSPPLELMVGHGQIYLMWHSASGNEVGHMDLGNATTGARHSVVLDVTFNTDKNSSPVSGYMDGRTAFTGAKISGTMYPGQSNYAKTGIYRDGTIQVPAEYILHGFKAGGSFTAVTT